MFGSVSYRVKLPVVFAILGGAVATLTGMAAFNLGASGEANSFAGLVIISAMIAAGVFGGVAFFFASSLSKCFQVLATAMGAWAKGEYDQDLPTPSGQDEAGQALRQATAFRNKLALDAERLGGAAFSSAVFKGSSKPMMMIDRDLRILDVNPANQKMMRDHQEEFRKHWPSLDPDRLVGTTIDVFHADPSKQRAILSDPRRLPYSTDITIGSLKLSLTAFAVTDTDGAYVGTVLEWDDVTELRTSSGVVDAMKRAQAYIEFDMNGNILSTNENFLATMKYRADDIVGRHHRIFADPEYAASAEYRAFWDNLRAGKPSMGKFRRLDSQGNDVWIQAIYTPVLDTHGKPFKVVKFASDVTKDETRRLQIEEEKQRNDEQQQVVVDGLAGGLKKLSSGDLTVQITTPFDGVYETLRADFNDAVANLRELLHSVTEMSNGINSSVSEISQAADDLSRRTENQAASLEETAAALDQATTSVKETAGNAAEASEIVSKTHNQAESSGEIVSEAVSAMGSIEKSSGEISQIIGVIDEIAFQTNLLALNAGVEAARAGDAGRGFAVVASEVRALAQRSSDAAKEIKTLISASSEHVSNGVELVGKAGEALHSIVGRVAEITTLVQTIATSAQEQSRGLGEINTAVNQMDQVTQQNAAMVEETTAASHSLKQEADRLLERVSHFAVEEGGVSPAPARYTPPTPANTPDVVEQQRRAVRFASANTNAAVAVDDAAEDDTSWDEF